MLKNHLSLRGASGALLGFDSPCIRFSLHAGLERQQGRLCSPSILHEPSEEHLPHYRVCCGSRGWVCSMPLMLGATLDIKSSWALSSALRSKSEMDVNRSGSHTAIYLQIKLILLMCLPSFTLAPIAVPPAVSKALCVPFIW